MAAFNHSMKAVIEEAPLTKWMGTETIKLLKCDFKDKQILCIHTEVNAVPYIDESIAKIIVRLKKDTPFGNREKIPRDAVRQIR